jgi:hypothetical protein
MCARNTSEGDVHTVGFHEFHYELANMATSVGLFSHSSDNRGCAYGNGTIQNDKYFV